MAYTKGGGSTIDSFIFERGWLKGYSVKTYRGWLTRGGAAYTSEYGILFPIY